MEVIYEPHPVTAERKAELRQKGLHIIDARFKPKDQLDEQDDQSSEQEGQPSEQDDQPKRATRSAKQ